MTRRLYLEDDGALEAEAEVVGVRPEALAFDRTCFYPGGGGQPADVGTVVLAGGAALRVCGVAVEADGVIWHQVDGPVAQVQAGQPARLAIDRERRRSLTRYHTVLHVLNTIALRDYGAWITGAQIQEDYARIDFKWDGFTPAVTRELVDKVQAVLDRGHPIRAYSLSEAEFAQRKDLLRTLEVQPPVVEGRVRVVAIEGFDEQACGGTHAASTAEIGVFSIYKTENKGKINKRLYVRLTKKD